MSDKTALGDRMKRYEHTYRQVLPRRTYAILRLDGRAFHTYLRGVNKPFDAEFMGHMDTVTQWLCADVQGSRFAYTQSDEISILISDFDTVHTEPWFGGNISKILSISAALASAYMARLRAAWPGLPVFDARVFTLSDPVEVANYFVWRQRDAVRNSISMAAQAQFSPAELHGKNADEMQDMLFTQRGINWNGYGAGIKRGRLVMRTMYEPVSGPWIVGAAPRFMAAPDTTLAALIPPLPSLHTPKEETA